MSAEAETDPPMGMPWKKLTAALATPWAAKSRESSPYSPPGLGTLLLTPAPWISPIAAIAMAGTMSPAAFEKSGTWNAGSPVGMAATSLTSCTPSPSTTTPMVTTANASTMANLRTGVRPSSEDQRHGHQAHGQRRPRDLVEVQDEVHRLGHLVRVLAAVAGEVAELAQDDEDADAGDEADHHAVGDELGDPAELEQAECQLNGPDHQGEHDEEARALIGAHLAHGVGHGQGDGARRGDRHEDRAGEQGADRRPDDQRVEPVHWLDGGEDRGRHRVRDLHETRGQAGDEVVLGVPAPRQVYGRLHMATPDDLYAAHLTRGNIG